MSELALQLIRKEKKERTGKLDLGNCGLRDFWPEELFELTWLEELVVSNSWWNWEKRKWIEGPNSGGQNSFSSLPAAIAQLKQLKKLKLGGDYQSGMFKKVCQKIFIDLSVKK